MYRSPMNIQNPNNEFIKDEAFHPESLIRRLEKNIPRYLPYRSYDTNEPQPDPIIKDLMKLTPHRPFVKSERNPEEEDSINVYSAKLSELLYLLNEEQELDENARISIESSLFEMTSYIPTPSEIWTLPYQQAHGKSQNQYPSNPYHNQDPVYPNESLSKILIDNYTSLHKFSYTYFNLSLSSHVTKYMVELAYSLQYWEVYHLIYILPELEYFLKLIDFEVIHTPFGPMIKPPVNYLNDAMLSGLQYPFPYPFYNYSYHSFDPKTDEYKMNKIKIQSYSGVSLMPEASQIRRKTPKSKASKAHSITKKEAKRPDRSRTSSLKTIKTLSSSRPSSSFEERRGEGNEGEEEDGAGVNTSEQYDERSKVGENVASSNFASSQNEGSSGIQVSSIAPESSVQNDKPSDESSSEDEEIIERPDEGKSYQEYGDVNSEFAENDSTNNMHRYQNQIKFYQGSPGKMKSESQGLLFEDGDDKSKKNKSGVIHQCHLTDPNTFRRCLKIFYGKNELLRHQEFVHATKKKIYKCIYCSRNGAKVQSYPRHDSLARHIRRKHGVTGKENKMAVNYAKENVEVIDDPNALVTKQHHFGKPLPHPQYLNSDFTIKPGYAGFLSFSSKDNKPTSPTSKHQNMEGEYSGINAEENTPNAETPKSSPEKNTSFQTFRVTSSQSHSGPEETEVNRYANLAQGDESPLYKSETPLPSNADHETEQIIPGMNPGNEPAPPTSASPSAQLLQPLEESQFSSPNQSSSVQFSTLNTSQAPHSDMEPSSAPTSAPGSMQFPETLPSFHQLSNYPPQKQYPPRE